MANEKVSARAAITAADVADADSIGLIDSSAGNDGSKQITLPELKDYVELGGIDITPGSDIDATIVAVGVTGTPTISWDESVDAFLSTKPIQVVPTVYVGPAGNDSNGGSRASPFLTIRAALTAVGAGGQVIALDGSYTYLYLTSADAGTAHQRTIIRAENKRGAKISGDATHHAVAIQVGGTDYITIDGFEITGDLDGVKMEGTYAIVENCWIHDTGGQGILCLGVGGIIRHNLFEDCGTDSQDHSVYSSVDDVQCYGNVSEGSSGYGLHFYEDSVGMTGCTIRNNWIDTPGTGGIWVHGPTGGGACGHVIRDNYVLMPYGSAFSPLYLDRCVSPTVKRNVFIGGNSTGPDVYEGYELHATSSVTYTDNVFYVPITDQNTHGATDTAEILSNGGFEDGGGYLTDWVKVSETTSIISEENVEQDTGSACVLMTMDGVGTYIGLRQTGVMTIGDVYTATVRFKVDNATGAPVVAMTDPSRAFAPLTTWQTATWTFAAESADFTLRPTSGTLANKLIYIDNVSLKKAYGPTEVQLQRVKQA